MRNSFLPTFGLIVVCLVPATAHSQPVIPSGAGTLDEVVRELRLLRQAVEKQSATAARVQLLMGRLTMQDQRTARAQQAVERAQNDLTSAERERSDWQSRLRAITERLEQAANDELRQPLEAEARMLRAHLAGSQGQVSSAESRLSQARQALEVETGRYDELDTWLKDIDKQLQGGAR